MSFDTFVNEGSGVKSSVAKELNNSMKIENTRASKHWKKVSSTLSSCFTILTTKPMVPARRMVSWKLWTKLTPTMW